MVTLKTSTSLQKNTKKTPKQQQKQIKESLQIKKMHTHQALVLQLHAEKLPVIHLLQALSETI
jgi:mRNA-degrading endonuclease RelE of RelBE toxin-antitoxin system